VSASEPSRTRESAPQAESPDGRGEARAPDVGVVVIGRNEGERLERSLRSARSDLRRVLYVDSGSSDGSVELGRRLASDVVLLDDSAPFTAARARNVGLTRLLELDDSLGLIQFVDGDCELEPGWLECGRAALERDRTLGAVCGRLHERRPDASPYARLSHIEWNRPAGDTLTCGGIAMFRVAALTGVGGFNASMIAGEEPELCYRLRRAGWRIARLDEAMAVHDGGMMTFRQWWLRAVRNGHAYAENAALRAVDGERGSLRPVASMLLWGLLAPLAAIVGAAAVPFQPRAAVIPLGVVSGYLLLIARIHRSSRRLGEPHRDAALYALFCVLAKLPHCLGAARYWIARARRRPSALIEYKVVEGRNSPRSTP
jgi:GT2 family glycosyltransferase